MMKLFMWNWISIHAYVMDNRVEKSNDDPFIRITTSLKVDNYTIVLMETS
jgi:hypothetical protein